MSLTESLLNLFVDIYPFIQSTIPNAGNNYEYNFKVLEPLAMTNVPQIKIFDITTPLPLLPKEQIPTQKWVSLVVSSITRLITKKKKPEFLDNKEDGTFDLENIHEEIKAAMDRESLTKAVLKLASAVEDKNFYPQLSRPENDSKLSINPNKDISFEEKIDEIERKIPEWLSEKLQEFAKDLKIEEDSITVALKKIVRKNIQFLERKLLSEQKDSKSTPSTPKIEKPSSLEDYRHLFSDFNIRHPETFDNFQEDPIFAYMQVAGPNPLMLNQIKKIDNRLPINSEQYQKIVPQDSLEVALEEGRLFLADYSKLEELANGSFGGIQKYMYAPLGLFAVPPDEYKDRNLLPIAIRCQQTQGNQNPIFTPSDGENWTSAKTVLQMANSNYHELISHLAHTHLFIEPFIVPTHRCFTEKNHPLRVLLIAHFQGTVFINYGAYDFLLAKGGAVDSLLDGTIGSDTNLSIKEALSRLANFNEVAFPRTIEKRGVGNAKQLPIYPYRDDGQLIWNAIYEWVSQYLRLFYPNDASIQADEQLQNWAHQLFSEARCGIGEDGDGHIKTLDYLVEAISTIIFTASAEHAAVNFPQSRLMTYAPAFPLGCYSPAPTNLQQQQNFISLLPPLDRAKEQIQVLYLLGSVYYTRLGHYSDSFFKNEKVQEALGKFQDSLQEIEQIITKENSNRDKRLVPYGFLLPSNIPQSINI